MNIFTQSSGKSRGFTLIELLTVVAIIGILVFVGASFSMKKSTNTEKNLRLSNAIVHILREEVLHTLNGKSIIENSKSFYPSSTEIIINTSSGILVRYLSGSNQIGTGAYLVPNYYGDPNYKISQILIGSGSYSGAVLSLIRGGETTLSPSGTGMTIQISYQDVQKQLTFDRRTNQVSVK